MQPAAALVALLGLQALVPAAGRAPLIFLGGGAAPNDACSLCKDAVSKLLSTGTQEACAAVCKEVAADPTKCDQVCSDIYGDFCQGASEDACADDVCKDIDLCQTAVKTPQAAVVVLPAASTPPNDVCSLCKDAVGKLLQSGTEKACEMACEKLAADPKKCSQVCGDIYGDFCQGASEDKCADDVCKDVNFCKTAVKSPQTAVVVLPAVNTTPNDVCSLCKDAVGKLLQTGTEKACGVVCKKLAADPTKCDQACGDIYGDFCKASSEDSCADHVCKDVDICKTAVKSPQGTLAVVPAAKTSPNDECSLCKDAVGKLLHSGTEKACDLACEKLAADPTKCEQFCGDIYGDFCQAASEDTCADHVCKDVDICKTAVKSPQAAVFVMPAAGTLPNDACALCKDAVSKLLQSGTETACSVACEKLAADPKKCNQVCGDIYGDFCQGASEDTCADNVCKDVELCKTTAKGPKVAFVALPAVRTVPNDVCTMCKDAVSKLLESGSEEACNMACGLVVDDPTKCDQLCSNIYGELCKGSSEDVCADDVCKEVDLCTAVKIPQATLVV